jgi:alpha-1,3-glucan synthase
LLTQFKEAIVSALESKPKVRAQMRAWSAKQRFPVAQWLDKLERLQSTAIRVHQYPRAPPKTLIRPEHLRPKSLQWTTRSGTPSDEEDQRHSQASTDVEVVISPPMSSAGSESSGPTGITTPGNWPRHFSSPSGTSTPSGTVTPANWLSRPGTPHMRSPHHSATPSILGVDEVVGDRHDYRLQTVEPFFTDSRGNFAAAFEKKLRDLNAHNSTTDLCIEEYLVKSEKKWFDMYRGVKLGQSASPFPLAKLADIAADPGVDANITCPHCAKAVDLQDAFETQAIEEKKQFGLPNEYAPPSGLKK